MMQISMGFDDSNPMREFNDAIHPVDSYDPLTEFDPERNYLPGANWTENRNDTEQCQRRPDTRTKEEKEREKRAGDEFGKYLAIAWGGIIAVVAIAGGIASGWFGDRWDELKDWWKNRGKKGGGDDGAAGTGDGSPPPISRVPPQSGTASRIAEVRRSAIETNSAPAAQTGFFRTAIAGIKNFFSLQIPMPSPVVVPMNVMPLGVFNPIFTVI